jgi:dihydrofolate reductase
MRKLKLQVQMSVDGFIGGPNGEMDWMTWTWDDKLKDYVTVLTDSVDTILLGRKMTPGFTGHWQAIQPTDPSYSFARKMVETPKYVFSKTLDASEPKNQGWENTTIVKGDLTEEVNKLKDQPGKDIVVYGGAGFDASLIKAGLIDEFHLFINPAAIGKGLSIFKELEDRQKFKLEKAIPFECGIVVLHYTKTN